MKKWLSKSGLKAIFSDVAKAPLNWSKGIYQQARDEGKPREGLVMAAAAQLPGVALAVSVGAAAGPFAAAAAYYGYSNAMTGMFALEIKATRPRFYPRMTAHAKKTPAPDQL